MITSLSNEKGTLVRKIWDYRIKSILWMLLCSLQVALPKFNLSVMLETIVKCPWPAWLLFAYSATLLRNNSLDLKSCRCITTWTLTKRKHVRNNVQSESLRGLNFQPKWKEFLKKWQLISTNTCITKWLAVNCARAYSCSEYVNVTVWLVAW